MKAIREDEQLHAAVEVYVLHPGLSASAMARLQQVVRRAEAPAQLSFVEIDSEKRFRGLDLRSYERLSETAYFRLLLGDLLPSRHEKVLYLDCDVIVEDNPLKLWSKDFEGQVLLATPERTVSCPSYGIRRWRELGLSPDDLCFNSGVLLIDMERWRTEDLGRRVLRYLDRHGEELNVLGDQEGLNAVLAGRWKALEQRWNVLHWYYDRDIFEQFRHGPVPSINDLPELIENPGIIHFTHDVKPWHPRCRHPAQDRFFYYLRQSGWLSSLEYVQWRGKLSAGSGVKWLKDLSRPYRHKIGIQ